MFNGYFTYILNVFFVQLEVQRGELLRERQQFHMEQLKAAEYRAKQLAAHQLQLESQQPVTSMADAQGP